MKALILFFLFVSTLARAFTLDDVKMVISQDFRFNKSPSEHRRSIEIHTSFRMRGKEIDERSDLMFAVLRDKLSRRGIPTSAGSDQVFKRYRSRIDASGPGSRKVEAADLKMLSQPRLFALFRAVPQKDPKRYKLVGALWLVGLSENQHDFTDSSAKLVWSTTTHVRDLSEIEIYEKLVYSLRSGADDLAKFFKPWKEGESHLPSQAGKIQITSRYSDRDLPSLNADDEEPLVIVQTSAPVTSNVSESAPATRTRFLQVGASVGTPAVGNVHLGLWGMGANVPLTFHVSGIYLSPESRGFQFELGYIFDREGSYQQALGPTLDLFNESRDEKTTTFDNAGRGTTQVVHIHEGKPFLGGAYTVQWGPVRLQAGAALRIGQGNESPFRFLIQAGFVPLIPF